MTNAVLKKVTAKDIQAVKDEVESKYLNRIEGHDYDYQGQQDSSGNWPRRYFHGAIVHFAAHPNPDSLLDIVLEKLGEGWTRSVIETTSVGAALFNVFLVKPVAQQQEDLKVLYAEAEAKLRAKVEQENEAIIEREVQLQIAHAAKLKAEQLARDEQEQADRIRMEVEEALGATRKAVRDSLGAK